MEPHKLLVVDDEAIFCKVIWALLTEIGYQVTTETDAHKVPTLLRQGSFDVLLMDLHMPGLDGLDLIESIRKDDNVLPIIVVTGDNSSETTVEAMRRGATDFVAKPVEGSLLDLRIRRAFDLEHSRRLANTDGLTGLYNHRHLQERLQQEVDRARRYGRPLSVVMADIDHFKRFNDTFGHPCGDEALIAVSDTLRQVGRTPDIVARYGGEEFLLVLPETELSKAMIVAERARQCVEALRFPAVHPSARLTLSLGVAELAPNDLMQEGSKGSLIKRADEALYRAKDGGRNCAVCLADSQSRSSFDTDTKSGHLQRGVAPSVL